jgi:hypothetical protein
MSTLSGDDCRRWRAQGEIINPASGERFRARIGSSRIFVTGIGVRPEERGLSAGTSEDLRTVACRAASPLTPHHKSASHLRRALAVG